MSASVDIDTIGDIDNMIVPESAPMVGLSDPDLETPVEFNSSSADPSLPVNSMANDAPVMNLMAGSLVDESVASAVASAIASAATSSVNTPMHTSIVTSIDPSVVSNDAMMSVNHNDPNLISNPDFIKVENTPSLFDDTQNYHDQYKDDPRMQFPTSIIPNGTDPEDLPDYDLIKQGTKRKLCDEDNGKVSSNGDSKSKLYIGDTVIGDEEMIIVPTQKPVLNYAPLKTGICYDVRMRYHAKIVTSSCDYTDPHPEDPRRIFRIYKILAENGLIDDPTLCGAENIGDLMQKVPVREATDEEILEIHSKEHLDYIVSTSQMSRQDLVSATTKSDSVYFNNESYQSARLSCGGAIEICKAVVERQVKNGLAVVRPPGHHAEPDVPGGFCLFSNVAVAAKNILKNYPEKVKKILVLDWDVHHGNGTQKSFWDDPNVLYISLHRYEDGKFYPATNFGGADKVGEGAGEGFSVNIPWPKPGMGDSDYLYAFNQVVMPIGMEFNPDLVIISAGFDAAEGDLLGGCLVSPDGYSQMTYMLKSLAGGNLAVILEGGYNLDSIAKSALAVTKILLGDAPGRIVNTLPMPETIQTVREIIRIQSRYWKSLLPGYGSINMVENTLQNYDYLHDALRSNQVRKYTKKYGLVTLPIIREKESSSYDDQILGSVDIHNKGTIVVIVHDSPEVWGSIDPVLGTLDNSQSIVVDGVPRFIEWAQKNDYGVLDINIPGSIAGQNSENYNVAIGSQDVCLYVWDNYIQHFDATKIIFVGINEAYSGIVHLVGHRETRERVNACISFIGDCQLRSIVTIIDEYITDWYYHSSLVFTSRYHPCWDKSINPKRPRRKFGRVIKADQNGSNRILEERFQEAIEFIEEALESEGEESDSG